MASRCRGAKSTPATKLTLNVMLTGDNGAETTRKVDYQVPIGAPPGTALLHRR